LEPTYTGDHKIEKENQKKKNLASDTPKKKKNLASDTPKKKYLCNISPCVLAM
jgi:hypothetical protein